MAGVKQFNNQSQGSVSITLLVRAGDNPANYAGTQAFTLNPGQSLSVTYGNPQNVYVNGYLLSAVMNGELYTKQEVVTTRGSQLDNTWNTNSKFDIGPGLAINAHN